VKTKMRGVRCGEYVRDVEIAGCGCVVNYIPVVLFTVGRSYVGEGMVMSIGA